MNGRLAAALALSLIARVAWCSGVEERLYAAWTGDAATIKRTVTRENVNEEDGDGNTLIEFAAEGGWPEMTAFLLDQGADLRDLNIRYLAEYALTDGRKAVLRMLFDRVFRGSDDSLKEEYGMALAFCSDYPTVRAILAAIDLSGVRDDDGDAPLHRAASIGRPESTKAFIDSGFDVNAQNEDGETPLMNAADAGISFGRFDETIAVILAAKPDLARRDRKGWTALDYAIDDGNVKRARSLVAAGAGVNVLTVKGETAIDLALAIVPAAFRPEPYKYPEMEEILRFLLESGQDLGARGVDGCSVLQRLVQYGGLDLVRMALERGASAEAPAKSGLPAPILIAAGAGDLEMVKLLERSGADLSVVDKDGEGVLDHALARNRAVFDYLISKGVRMGLRTAIAVGDFDYIEKNGMMPDAKAAGELLGVAVRKGNVAAIAYLLRLRPELKTAIGSMESPVATAAEWDRYESMEALLEAGYDSNPRSGGSPLIRAVKNGNLAMVKLLMRFGADPLRTDSEQTTAEYYALSQGNLMIANALLIGRKMRTVKTGLRVRASPDLGAAVLKSLGFPEEVILADAGPIVAIDGIQGFWAKVKTKDGAQGWCFSGYLE